MGKLSAQSVILIRCEASAEVILIYLCDMRSREVTASLLPASACHTGHRVQSRPPRHSMTTVVKSPTENTPHRVTILWQALGDSTLRLRSQPAWNDARGGILA